MGDCEQVIRELDALVQGWISVHQRATSTASTMCNLHEQSEKTLPLLPQARSLELLLAMQQEKIEQSKKALWKAAQEYGGVVRSMDQLHARVGKMELASPADHLEAVAGITPAYAKRVVADRREAYTGEYLRRVDLIQGLLIKGELGIREFTQEWMESKVDYAVEEEYLERLRLARLARQWQSNQEAAEAASAMASL
ncbi:hypothetical protein GQ54DRAFT_159222 [Martensiomyces pterosporus]|nr:hypothetical protein GQ54DRAFT_159222 [Martensiomyces pterosporus]